MNDYYIRAAVQTADRGGALPEEGAASPENLALSIFHAAGDDPSSYAHDRPVTMAELHHILRSVLSGLRVYVLESDITSSQNAARAIIEQSKF